MPSGGKRGKRTDVNLEKHLEKKRSVIRQIDNDPQFKSIVDHRWPMQTVSGI